MPQNSDKSGLELFDVSSSRNQVLQVRVQTLLLDLQAFVLLLILLNRLILLFDLLLCIKQLLLGLFYVLYHVRVGLISLLEQPFLEF